MTKLSYFQFNFSLTSLISSMPKGLPCAEAFPLLLGDPKPIFVLHAIAIGFFEFCAILNALFISLKLWPSIFR